jgi:Xaa-Pro aminopeptidase
MCQERLSALKRVLKARGVSAFLVTDPFNIFYLSGFRAENACLLITTSSRNFVITDFRFREEAGEVNNFSTALIKTSTKELLLEILRGEDIKKVAFESDSFSYARALAFRNALKRGQVAFLPLSGVVEDMRMRKDAGEIKQIKTAVGIAKRAFASFERRLKPGKTEKELKLELERSIVDLGGEKEAFDIIVASGPRSSRPHAEPSSRTIRKNESVLVDFGVRWGSYNCDLTRMVFLGKIQKLLYKIYNICGEAQARAIKTVRPGITAAEIDRAARDYIDSKGFGKAFGHSLGHGIGLSVHELPRISAKSKTVLTPGMVITIEPGIYIEGVGGVRIEDMVHVTGKGCEVLTDDIPK